MIGFTKRVYNVTENETVVVGIGVTSGQVTTPVIIRYVKSKYLSNSLICACVAACKDAFLCYASGGLPLPSKVVWR